jgi:4-amino-4-deoxy-L-arabinose transferase-like glycosyltransferase
LLLVLLLLSGSIHAWLIGHTVVPARDSVGFIRYAWQLQHQDWLAVLKNSHQHPGYPVAILGASIPVGHLRDNSLCDVMVRSAQLVNWLAGCLLVFPMFYIGKDLFDRRVAFGTAALFQCLPVAARVTSDSLSEGTFLLTAAVTLLVAVRAFRFRSSWRFGLCGACGGLCYLIRPEGALTVAAVGLVLLGTQLVPQWRWRWGTTIVCAGSLVLAALVIAGPYVAVISHFTNKPTGQAIMEIAHGELGPDGQKSGLRDQESGLRGQESASLLARWPRPIAQPFMASLVGVWWQSDRETGVWEHLAWGLWAVGKEVVRGFFYIAWLPAILGLFWFHGRFRDVPGPWIFGGLCLLQTLVLWRVGLVVGYVSERHILIIVLCGLYWAVAAILEFTQRWSWTLQWIGNARTQPVLIMLVLMLSCLPWTLQPLHANQVGHREAGLWLAEHAQAADSIVDPFNWAYYYSGRVFQEDTPPPTPPEHKPLRYVVLEHSRKQHPGLTLLPLAKQLATGGQVVYDWQPNRHQLKHMAQEVQIFAVPFPTEKCP